ncbi:hypothetical protein ON010_g8232 [Phytophthora cinnamomi]|nr:hypothetical protein ON010_g8232 [Phytophthora cinnamomi]
MSDHGAGTFAIVPRAPNPFGGRREQLVSCTGLGLDGVGGGVRASRKFQDSPNWREQFVPPTVTRSLPRWDELQLLRSGYSPLSYNDDEWFEEKERAPETLWWSDGPAAPKLTPQGLRVKILVDDYDMMMICCGSEAVEQPNAGPGVCGYRLSWYAAKLMLNAQRKDGPKLQRKACDASEVSVESSQIRWRRSGVPCHAQRIFAALASLVGSCGALSSSSLFGVLQSDGKVTAVRVAVL